MTPEQELLRDLIGQAERSTAGLAATAAMVGEFPRDAAAFDAMSPMQLVATTALLKQFEQLEGALHGAFRVALKMMGVSLKGLYPLDIGERLVELDVLDDGRMWLAAVKLRNELAHEYPFDAASRFDRARAAFDMATLLKDALARFRTFVATRKLLDV